MECLFPFGQPLRRLAQQDQTPKDIFVLGVYASAVHAKWASDNGIVCQALAVASEPRIFWDGDREEAERIIHSIHMPKELGVLVPANKNLNGPSANVLDEHILLPLRFTRENAWLCDLLPESRLNPNQVKVIHERYDPLIAEYHLNPVTVPIEDGHFCDVERRVQITKEIRKSKAKTLVLLGDIPIRQYLAHVANVPFKSLREFSSIYGYGQRYPVIIDDMEIDILPLAHPRQIGRLGASSKLWFDEHKAWEEKRQ